MASGHHFVGAVSKFANLVSGRLVEHILRRSHQPFWTFFLSFVGRMRRGGEGINGTPLRPFTIRTGRYYGARVLHVWKASSRCCLILHMPPVSDGEKGEIRESGKKKDLRLKSGRGRQKRKEKSKHAERRNIKGEEKKRTTKRTRNKTTRKRGSGRERVT